MPVDLTSPWIPLSIILLLGIFMVRQFIQERRDARALAEAEPSGDAGAAASAEAAVAVPQSEPVAAAPEDKPKKKKKMKLRWRTAWIWLPFLIGFFGQFYLSFIKPLVDGTS